MNNTKKMLLIASQLNDLNENGEVKSFRGNEKGYARVRDIVSGCTLWVHHLADDRIIIDLMVSPSAKENTPIECDKSIRVFKEIFGFSAEESTWTHAIDNYRDHERYYIDVSDMEFNQITSLARKTAPRLL